MNRTRTNRYRERKPTQPYYTTICKVPRKQHIVFFVPVLLCWSSLFLGGAKFLHNFVSLEFTPGSFNIGLLADSIQEYFGRPGGWMISGSAVMRVKKDHQRKHTRTSNQPKREKEVIRYNTVNVIHLIILYIYIYTLRIMGSQNWWFGDQRDLLYRFKPHQRRVQ